LGLGKLGVAGMAGSCLWGFSGVVGVRGDIFEVLKGFDYRFFIVRIPKPECMGFLALAHVSFGQIFYNRFMSIKDNSVLRKVFFLFLDLIHQIFPSLDQSL
jgi:hypothetical protein